MSGRVYGGLSAYYFAHLAIAGALFPYLALYLHTRGFGPSAIGELFAALTITKVIAPYFWAWVADRHSAHLAVVRWTSLAGAACFTGFVLEPGYGALMLVFVIYSLFWNGTLPQIEALTLSHLRDAPSRYARIRLWGSVGYIVTVAGLGAYFEIGSIGWLPALSLALMLTVCLVAWLVPPAPPVPPREGAATSIWGTLARPQVVAFFGCCLLMQASHGTYYTFYTVYLEGHGYSSGSIGALWALGVVSEIGLFMFIHRVLERFSVRALMIGCFALTSARWWVLAQFVDSAAAVVSAQLLHAVSYGAFHAISILLLGRHFPGTLGGRGQAIYASVSFGLGGALGSLSSGYLWAWLGGSGAFLFAGAVSAAGALIAWRWVR